jgi:hypothetical protein
VTSTKTIRQALHQKVVDWFAGSDLPYATGNIKRYQTAPDDSSESPYWTILFTMTQSPDGEVAGGSDTMPRFGILLLCRVGGDEASKEAAHDWLDEAEQMLLNQLNNDINQDYWTDLLPGDTLRDRLPQYHGRYRTSLIPVAVETR